MEEIILKANTRDELGTRKAKTLRKSGFIPSVVYGGGKSQTIKISRFDLIRFLREHKGENVIIDLKVAENDKKIKDNTVMIKNIQYDPVTEAIIHLDFNKISLTKTVSVKVPVEAKGEPEGVKLDGGVLEHILWELEIECLPKDMPKSVEVDVSQLKIGDSIHVKDIDLPESIKIKHEPEAIILSVAPPAKEEIVSPEEVAVAEAGAKEPEVIKEKKEEGSEPEAKETKESKTKEGKAEKKEKS